MGFVEFGADIRYSEVKASDDKEQANKKNEKGQEFAYPSSEFQADHVADNGEEEHHRDGSESEQHHVESPFHGAMPGDGTREGDVHQSARQESI